jgi:ribosome-associated protein
MIKQASGSDTETPVGFRVVEVSREPVELYKILKFEGLVSSGGEAKVAVASGQVSLNGEIETQKRKKIVSGDTIEFGEDKICIKLSLSASNNVAPPKVKVKPAAKKKIADRKAILAISKGSKKK